MQNLHMRRYLQKPDLGFIELLDLLMNLFIPERSASKNDVIGGLYEQHITKRSTV